MAMAAQVQYGTRRSTARTWVVGLCLSVASLAAPAQSVDHGRALYESRCSACHSVDANRTGPLHAGVLGRRAGSVQGFDYSAALAASRLVWSRETLLAWLRDPEALIPGQAMGINVPDATDRQDLVAYLMTLNSNNASPQ